MDNIIIYMTDQERFPVHINEHVLTFLNSIPGYYDIKNNGAQFCNHYTATTACCPARTSLFTGHYPLNHRVTQTYGYAKGINDSEMMWLDKNMLPTMGHYFRELGYRTGYIGKWHLSYEDIVDEKGIVVNTVTDKGERILENEQKYYEQNKLSKYGFDDWIGPEPHGSSTHNTGMYRDGIYKEIAIDWLKKRDNEYEDGMMKPFLLVISLVNPHDIVIYPKSVIRKYLNNGDNFFDDEIYKIPDIPDSMSDEENLVLNKKPRCHKSYRDVYQDLVFPRAVHSFIHRNKQSYRKFYYYLHKLVYVHINDIRLFVKTCGFYSSLFEIFTTDHGDLLGSHGWMHQKWHTAYDEVIHIPLSIHHKTKIKSQTYNFLTSSIDILPTMIGLTNNDYNVVHRKIISKYYCKESLPGVDLSNILLRKQSYDILYKRSIYFNTEDDVSKGDSQIKIFFILNPKLKRIMTSTYKSVSGPKCVEAIIKYVNHKRWKLCRYYFPNNKNSYSNKEEFELYCNDDDPYEINNLYYELRNTPFVNELMIELYKKSYPQIKAKL